MIQIALLSFVALLAGGLAIKFILDRKQSWHEITWKEFIIGSTIMAVVVIPATVKIGWEMAVASQLSYHQYLNGWETAATNEITTCTRDGPCRYEYDCDPYIVMVPYECGHYSGSGENRHYVSQTCHRPETRYHSCPYVDYETSYFVNTTLGTYTIAEHRFPENPQTHRWRELHSIPSYVIDRAGVGEPPFWVAVKKRVDANDPGPVCKRSSYENYILASEHTILKQYSSEVEQFAGKNLLPKLQSSVYEFYSADKAYFVGYRPPDAKSWQSELRYLNAALGSEFQGDLHLVIVQNPVISQNPDVYAFALQAYWQNPKVFGRDAFSKNGIAVVVGTEDGQTVSWSRAFTGMPLGNEMTLVALRNKLKGLELEPGTVIGSVRKELKQAKAKHGAGALETVLWGLNNKETKFQRISMTGKDPGDNGSGFLYLRGEIRPTGSQKAWITFFVFMACGICWAAFVFVGEKARRTRN